MKYLPILLEVTGAGVVLAAVAVRIDPWLAAAVGGFLAIWVGYVFELREGTH